jgi:hypothetical protein
MHLSHLGLQVLDGRLGHIQSADKSDAAQHQRRALGVAGFLHVSFRAVRADEVRADGVIIVERNGGALRVAFGCLEVGYW